MSFSRREIAGGIALVAAVADAIKALGSTPSGHLYAHLCGHMSLEAYNSVISLLKRAELVTEENYVLTWIGGDVDPVEPLKVKGYNDVD